MKKTNSKSFGFTLIEVIAVIILLGVLSATVFQKTVTVTEDLSSISSAMKSHLRYVQAKALGGATSNWGFRMDVANNQYWLFNCDSSSTCKWTDNRSIPPAADSMENLVNDQGTTNDATDDTLDIDSAQNISIQSVTITGAGNISHLTVLYDNYGVPYFQALTTAGDLTLSSNLNDSTDTTLLVNSLIITINDQSGNTDTITITPESGFIQ